MGKSLIITEKPSVAREFARILGVSGRNDGYIEDSHYAITWCVGHLVEMVYPEEYDIKYKKWKLEDLPFLPKDYKYNVIPSVSKQYDIVHKLLHREDIDTVYWAGDAGKEGQTIEENIRRFGGVREGMKELRVWIDSQTEEEIKRGIAEARPMSDYDNLANSGIMRTIEDYAMGINFSRVMSVKYGNLLNDAAGTKSYTAIAVGRVMTCVLGMVVIREREIRNFVETPFYRVVGNFFDAEIEGEWKAVEGSSYYASPLLYKENGFKEKVHAEKLIKDLTNKTAIVKTVDKGISKKRAPLLFNLAELQAECSKRFKISPDETLQVAQNLYERKLTTYPRTDARVLSSAVAKEISKNIRGLRSFEPVAPFVQNIVEHGLYKNIGKSSYTDDSKITDHYAIVPTGQVNEYKSLTELQKRVYELIVRRFLSIFYPPAQYQTVKLTIGIEKESFFAGAKVLKVPGYLEIAGRPDTKEKREKEDGDGEENNPKNSAALLKLADSLKEGDTAEQIITGVDFEKLPDPEAAQRVLKLKIMCRARPTDKQRLVELLKQSGAVVAVTGDGTNDAPALNHADVGLSMGTGTSVAKEASDITLLDDSFNSIATAVMWGRSLYHNIQRFILFQLTINLSALLIVLLGSIFGQELPLTVTQMLWVNMIIDTFAAAALASLPPNPNVMEEKPRKSTDFIITKPMRNRIIGIGISFTIILLGLMYYFTNEEGVISRYNLSVFFTTFVLLQFWNMFNAKAFISGSSAFKGLSKSTGFLIVMGLIPVGQFLIVEFGGDVFRTVPLSLKDWGIIIGLTSVVLWMGEIVRLFRKK